MNIGGTATFRTLGRTGLKVSPLALGVMTFGWGADKAVSRRIFDVYRAAGGNFVDTADMYAGGTSEEWLGEMIQESGSRDQIVLATKFSFNAQAGNPNAGGNGRKNLYRALEGSLRRLKTDYVDLYYLHAWDTFTPVEEVLSTMDDLVSEGKIRYYGMSDTPAWYFSRMQTIAEKEGKERIATLQLEYSLAERNIEREHIPAAQELGIGLCPWSPLAGGFLSGKYKREGNSGKGEGRLTGPRSIFNKFTEHNWRVLEVLQDVSKKLGRSPAQVSLNWLATQPGVTSVILGARTTVQLDDNLGSLDFTIPSDLRERLEIAGAPEAVHPYNFYVPWMQARVSGNVTVQPWRPANIYVGATAPPAVPETKAAGEP